MLRNRLFLAVVSGHFAIDMLNSIGAVLLAVLAVPLGLSNSQIGIAMTIYLLVGSLSQPVFGWLSDKLPGRVMLLCALSLFWMAGLFVIVAFANSWMLLLPFFLLASLGSGLFHPIGTATASAAIPERSGSATAVFFFGGQMGLASGPILAGVLAGVAGAKGIIPLALLAVIPAALMLSLAPREAQYLPQRPAIKRAVASGAARRWTTIGVALIAAFVVLVATRSSIQAIYQSFLPKLFSDRGWEPAIYGLLAGVFMSTAAVGNIVAGQMADRWGMRAATVLPLILSVPAGLICLLNLSLASTFIACGFAGFLVGGQHSVLVLHAQRLLPAKQGFAAGLILGFTFASGALGTWAAGIAADTYGLDVVMMWATVAGLPAALLAWTLPSRPTADLQSSPAATATASAD